MEWEIPFFVAFFLLQYFQQLEVTEEKEQMTKT